MNRKTVLLIICGLLIGALIAAATYFVKPQQPKTIEDPKDITPIVSLSRPQPYYLSQVSSETTITGISWGGDRLLYSTSSGIYEPLNSTPLINTNIDYISWSQNGHALFLNNNAWYQFNPNTNKAKTIKILGSEAHISPNGKETIVANGKIITKVELENNKEERKMILSKEPTSIIWGNQEFLVVTINNNGDSQLVEIYDSSFNLTNTIELKPNDKVLTLSSDGTKLAIHTNDQFRIINTTSDKIEQTYELHNKSRVQITWISEQELITVESFLENPAINRKTENIWRMSSSSLLKEFLTNTNPIPGKLDLGIPPKLNGSRTVLALIENNGPIWLLSLKPGLAANYSPSGISFIPIPTPQRGNEL